MRTNKPTPRPESPELVMVRARFRSAVVVVGAILGYVVLGLRAVPLMLMPDDKLQDKAATQFQHAVQVDAPRGDLLARDGTLLATTVDMPALHADPARIAQHNIDPTELARSLADLLARNDVEVNVGALARKLAQPARRDVQVAKKLPPELADLASELDPPGVLWTPSSLARYYPGRDLAAQVLGIVGHNGRGLEGVERGLDASLRGATYRYVQKRDRRGRPISTAVEARGRALTGDNVTLTLDPYIQRAAEDALDEMVLNSEPQSAMAVVMDVKTGEVLALANRPTINPNAERDIASLRNHAVADAHEPGSVLKPFVVALALREGIVEPNSMIDCENGRWRVGRSIINDDHPHSVVTLGEVVKFSSNVGVAKLALEMGGEELMSGLEDFGFASRTGIDLPAEVRGFLRSPKRIRPIELATTAFGQGMTSNAMQLAAALGALGNEGVRMQPYVVKEVRDRMGYVKTRNKPHRVERVVSKKIADDVMKMMASVMEEGGTGTRARIPGYTSAGKTGTAQKVVDGRYSPTARVASFIGLAPAEDPRIAIVVMADTPEKGSRYGGSVSGPAFSSIGLKALRYLGVPEDAPDLEPELESDISTEDEEVLVHDQVELRWTADGQLGVPDLSGMSMRDVLVVVDGAGLELALMGSGRVIEQRPAPGEALNPGGQLEVRFQ